VSTLSVTSTGNDIYRTTSGQRRPERHGGQPDRSDRRVRMTVTTHSAPRTQRGT